jgi:hypothetical protein
MPDENCFDVYWEGPYDTTGLDEVSTNCVLYMICGTHGLYGRNVPLYIGKVSRQTLKVRIRQHESDWLNNEPDPVKIYAGYVGIFNSWEETAEIEEYPSLPDATIDAIESLLIYSHQPVYNVRGRQNAIRNIGHIRLFNTGRRSTLYPEVSSLYWVDSPASHLNEQLDM